MEIYRNELANIDLPVPVYAIPGSFDIKAYSGTELLHTFSTVTAVAGGYRVTLPFSLVVNDSSFVIVWKFNYLEGSVTKAYEHRTSIDVVTPYVTLSEFKTAIPEIPVIGISDTELIRLERRIRGVITNYTGQEFGRYVGSREVIGAGDEELKLADRLVQLDNITGTNILYSEDGIMAPGFYAIRGDGWYVGVSNPTPDGDYVFENVIRSPNSMWNLGCFRDNVVYTVDGVWGYSDIPAEVREAALIIAEDELCPQSEYRDRYLKSISGDGWRYEFNPNAYFGTGSVTADQILDKFRRSSMTVI
jgi:hypothetical protein